MIGIYIGSTTPRSGKSLLSFSLGVLLQQAGLRVGYMKPLGNIPQKVDELPGDADALVIQEVLGQQAAADIVTPIMIPQGLHSLSLFDAQRPGESLNCITDAYTHLAQNADIMLVSGTGIFPATGKFCGADGLTIVKHLQLKVLLIENFDSRINYDALLHLKEILGDSLLGVVLNDVPLDNMRDAEYVLAPYLDAHAIPVLGIIPREPGLWAMRVADIAYNLGGCVVTGNAQSSRMIEDFILGVTQVDTFMPHLKNHSECAAIMEGDRVDLQLAALHAACPCLILAGNIPPCELIRTRADKQGTPIITVREDTYSVACTMSRILKAKKLRDLKQIRIGISLVKGAINLAPILKETMGSPCSL